MVYPRESFEFERVGFFTDAVYAIAMTLLVVELHVPEHGIAELWGERWAVFGFFLGFLLLGRYWLAHHAFFASLRSLDRGMIVWNLVYLSFVAVTPFTVALISRYEDSPVSFVCFALNMAAISALEVVMMVRAARERHLSEEPALAVLRNRLAGASGPVGIILLSLPLGLYDSTLGLLSWLAMIPWGRYVARNAPREPEQPPCG